MTDDEIILSMECCNSVFSEHRCKDCPMQGNFRCSFFAIKNGIDLINRQKSEIERLKLECYKLYPKGGSYSMQVEVSDRLEHQIKSEAIKEFAERLKTRIRKDIDEQGMLPLPYTKKAYDTVMIFVDNLVKEMTEGN